MNAKTRTKLEDVVMKAQKLDRSMEKLLSHIGFYGSDLTEGEANQIREFIEFFQQIKLSEKLDYLKETLLEE